MKAKKNIPKIDVQLPEGKPLIKSPNLFPVVGIGASAGGLDAFKKLLKAIPENSGMAYVLVQHLHPKHESMLPELLQKVTPIPVVEITDDIKVQPDHIYVIPSNKMMVATDGVLLLAPRPAKSNTERNLPIDLFFTSLAEVHQEHAIGVVLSGTASDGTMGLKAIKDHGGITFAQDEASAEYEGMPHSAVQAGVVDFILPPHEIPKKLLELTNKTILSDEELQKIPKQDEDVFRQILSLLRLRKGVDFTYYKQTTVRRRILRRMVVNKNEETGDYLKFLRGNNSEQDLLYQDMLIPVTSFFRDKKVFEDLCNHVFPAILKNKIPGEITRIWVAGCSTGQEAYSFAICFKEFLGDDHERIQIFGTDLSEPAITKARTGMYDKSEIDGISPERLKEFFTKNNGGYQVNKSIRDMCVFAHHNFLKDPPFGKMDCISCRNVLIYMEPYLQKKALTTFHYALNPKGFLLLGKSETTSGVPDLFALSLSKEQKNDKLYIRKDVPGRFMQVTSQRSEQILSTATEHSKNVTDRSGRTDFQKTADDILLTKYTPAGVVVNETMDIVHFRGNTANYLQQAPGKPSHNLLMMAKNGLGFELRNILHKAKNDKAAVEKENIPLSVNGQLRNISIEAIPLPNTLEPYYLVLFHDNNITDAEGTLTGSGGNSNRKKVSAKTKKDEKDIQIKLLEQELAQAREDMRSITEDQEASNEELQSANEELLSGSEELQSLNEELETSKEELQSTNEELTVLNHELINLNEQVTDARNYAESIVSTLYQPLLVLDKNLRVKTANKSFYKTFKVDEKETEGVLIYDLGNRQWNIPELRTLLEEILPQKKQITDFEVTHNFLSIGQRIILLSALELTREKREEKLILLSIEDVTERKEAAKKIEENEKHLQNIFLNAPAALCILEGIEQKYILANKAYEKLINRKAADLLGKNNREVFPELAGTGTFELFDKVFETGEPFTAPEHAAMVDLNNEGVLRQCYFNFSVDPLKNDSGKIYAVMVITYDITEQVEARKRIEENDKQKAFLLKLSDALRPLNNPVDIEEAATKIAMEFMDVDRCFYANIEDGNAIILRDTMRGDLPSNAGVYPLSSFTLLKAALDTGSTYIVNDVNTSNIIDEDLKQICIQLQNHSFINIPVIKNRKSVGIFCLVQNIPREWTNAEVQLAIETAERTWAAIERAKAEDALRKSEEKYRSLFNSIDQGLVLAELIRNKEGKGIDYYVHEVNYNYEKQTGINIEMVLGKSILQSFPAIDKWWIETYAAAVDNQLPVKFEKFFEFTNRWFEIKAFPNGKEMFIILFTDITERKQAEEKIKESEFRYHEMVYSSPSLIAIFKGEDMIIEIANDAILDSWGKGKDVIGKSVFFILPEIVEQGFDKLLLSVYKTGKPFHAFETPVTLLRNGINELNYYNFIYQAQHNAAGEIEGVAVIANEVTAQVELNKKIKESEAFNRTVLESSPDCVKMLDEDGRLQFMNSNGICLLEIDDFKSVKNTYWWDMWEPHNQQIIKDAVATAKSGEKIQLQIFGPTAKGTPKWWDIIVLPVQKDGSDKNFNRILSVSRDITEQKQSELKEKELLARFQTLVIQAPVAICVLRGKDYVIETINEGMIEMWDRKIEEVINKPVFDVQPEFRDQGLKELLDNVTKTGERIVLQELPLTIRRHGTMENIFVKFVYEPLREADGSISGVMALAHEITEQVLSRKKVEASEKQFRQMAELMPQKVWTADTRGNKNYFNQTLLDYAGLSLEELKGDGWQKIIHPDDWEKNKTRWQESLSTGNDYQSENRFLRKDGKYIWHLTLAVALKDADGKIIMWIGSKTEIQSQKEQKQALENAVKNRTQLLQEANKELEQKNEELVITKEKLFSEYSRSLIEASLDPLITISTEGKIMDMNQATVNVTDTSREKLTGTNFSDYFTDPEKAKQGYLQVFAKGFVTDYPLTILDGKLTPVLFNASVYKDEQGKVLGAVIIARDITGQKRFEKELTAAKELAEIATAIAEAAKNNAEKAAAIAEEAVKSKQQFLSNMSHEIRTPMNAIIGFSKVALKTDLSEKQKEYLTAIKISGDALIVLINDILDLAKVDSGKITFEQTPFALADSVTAMLHLFEPKIQEKNIALVKEYDSNLPAVLLGDPVRLHQIIVNLVGNAVKFTNEGKITVSVNLLSEDEEKVTVGFVISDTGIGIPPDRLEAIFENFQQATSDTTRLYGGTGLGLAISKQLVEMQGGKITVKSKTGQGAAFSFTLSFKKTTATVEAVTEIIKTNEQPKNIKVLVAEDVALNQLLIKTLLEDFGFDCEICANGKLAIEKLHTSAYDIVLMDLQMPEMNGFETTKYIRHTMHSKIPIIALTADVTTVDVAKCKAAGMDDYISKPVDEKLLYSKIIKLMEKVQPFNKIVPEKKVVEIKYTNLEYLQNSTRSNSKLMAEFIEIYLKQTSSLINSITQSLHDKNWEGLQAAAHKLIPSFSIVGMSPDYTAMAKKIHDYAGKQEYHNEIHNLAVQLTKACGAACKELEAALVSLKSTNHE